MPEPTVHSEWGEGDPETEHLGVYVGEWPDGHIEWQNPQPLPPVPPAPDPPQPPPINAPTPPPVKRPRPPLPQP